MRGAALRFLWGPVLGLLAACALVTVAAQGCGLNEAVIGICPDDGHGHSAVPRACCPCSAHADCPDGEPPIPAWCCQDGRKPYSLYGSTCVADDGGADGSLDASADGAMSAIACPSPDRCLPPAPGFLGPEFVYKGAALGALECPVEAPTQSFYGVADPSLVPPPPLSCPACACDAPEGACTLPATWTVSSAACADPAGGIKTPFDPPAGWDGACLADKAIPAGAMCSGKPCVRSVTVSAPVLEETPCTPRKLESEPKPTGFKAELPLDWRVAQACGPASPWLACKGEEDKLCVPKPSEAFATCVRAPGDVACPAGWPVRALYFADWQDARACSDCACSAPMGGSCLVRATVASDATCSAQPQPLFVSSMDPGGCVDVPSGVALGSKEAALLAYEPGTCTPLESVTEGKVDVSGPVTLCCLADG
jgi:hypothetical protein